MPFLDLARPETGQHRNRPPSRKNSLGDQQGNCAAKRRVEKKVTRCKTTCSKCSRQRLLLRRGLWQVGGFLPPNHAESTTLVEGMTQPNVMDILLDFLHWKPFAENHKMILANIFLTMAPTPYIIVYNDKHGMWPNEQKRGIDQHRNGKKNDSGMCCTCKFPNTMNPQTTISIVLFVQSRVGIAH